MKTQSSLVTSCLTAVALMVVTPLSWASSSWGINFVDECTMGGASTTSGTTTYYRQANCNDAGSAIAGTATGWTTAPSTDASATFTQSYMGRWNGLGVEVSGTPQHAVDNNTGTDLIAIQFSQAVNLSSVSVGWNGTDDYGQDSDISVLAYIGNGTPPATVDGRTVSGLTTSGGWSLVGHYSNLGSMANNTASVNSGGVSSSWWLISAYNGNYGNNPGWTTANDYFKLLAVAGTYTLPPPPSTSVPEPSSLALAGLGLIAAVGFRRRQQARLAA